MSRSVALTIFGCACIALPLALPALACSPAAEIGADPEKGAALSDVTINGNLFDPNGSVVSLWWGGPNGSLLATTAVSPDGTFSTVVTVPAGSTAGPNLISATLVDADGRPIGPINTTFNVEVAPPPPQPNPGDGAVPPGPVGNPGGVPNPDNTAPNRPEQPNQRPHDGARNPGETTGQPAGDLVAGTPPGTQTVALGSSAQFGSMTGTGAAADGLRRRAEMDPLITPAEVKSSTAGQGAVSVPLSGGPSAWLLAPLAILALAGFAIAAASFVHDYRHVLRARVPLRRKR